ncbi:MAG TPA: hypothetical protein VGW75_04620 [Solirubrobacteraceae bacterium]|nr:hypothetical protein [Solirubrobacteraceae bacterium]
MSQVSLPVRIALAASLAFAALWFVALRPKPVPDAAAPAPAGAQSAPGKAVEKAQDAAAAQKAGVDKSEAAAAAAGSETAAAPSGVAARKKAAQPGAQIDVSAGEDVSRGAQAVLRDVGAGKVAILLFWDRRVSDDRAVRAAVEAVSRRRGKVAVHTASMQRLADYEPITRGVPVVTSPTVLVIDRARRARSVGGLTVTRELEDLVDKAIRVRP